MGLRRWIGFLLGKMGQIKVSLGKRIRQDGSIGYQGFLGLG